MNSESLVYVLLMNFSDKFNNPKLKFGMDKKHL